MSPVTAARGEVQLPLADVLNRIEFVCPWAVLGVSTAVTVSGTSSEQRSVVIQ